MKQEKNYCYSCNSEVIPSGLVCTYTNNAHIMRLSDGKHTTYKTPNNLEEIKTTFCKNCKKETTLGIKKEDMTKEIKDWLIEHDKVMTWITYLQSKKWFCHNCGRKIPDQKIYYCNETGSNYLILKGRCKRCGCKNGHVIDYIPLKKYFKSSGKSKRSTKNKTLAVTP